MDVVHRVGSGVRADEVGKAPVVTVDDRLALGEGPRRVERVDEDRLAPGAGVGDVGFGKTLGVTVPGRSGPRKGTG